MFRYSDKMINFLREHKNQMTLDKLTKEFNKRFKQNKSVYAIHRVCYDNGLCQKNVYDNNVKDFIKRNISLLNYKEMTKKVNEKFNLNKSVSQIKSFCIYHKIYNEKGDVLNLSYIEFKSSCTHASGNRVTDTVWQHRHTGSRCDVYKANATWCKKCNTILKYNSAWVYSYTHYGCNK